MAPRSKYNFLLGLLAGFIVSVLLGNFQTFFRLGEPTQTMQMLSQDSPTRLAYQALKSLRAGQDGVGGGGGGGGEGGGGGAAGGWGDALPGHAGAEAEKNVKMVKFQDLHAHHDDDTEARKMAMRVRVLVWVMTGPQNLDKKAIHIRNTWGKRASTLLFMSSQWNSTFPTIGLNVSEGREHLTAKTMQAFRYIYQHHFDDADWFMKADDDTYVIMENLRYMLSAYSSDSPVYFGHIFKVIVKNGYASGGAGYVLSKEALRRLATRGIPDPMLCREDGGAEDVQIGRCLLNLGIKLAPSLDRLGRSRFHCFGPEGHIHGKYPKWYEHYDANGAHSGIETVSDYPVSFHYISPSRMYAMEYFVYHLRPHGIISRTQDLNVPLNITES